MIEFDVLPGMGGYEFSSLIVLFSSVIKLYPLSTSSESELVACNSGSVCLDLHSTNPEVWSVLLNNKAVTGCSWAIPVTGTIMELDQESDSSGGTIRSD